MSWQGKGLLDLYILNDSPLRETKAGAQTGEEHGSRS